MGARFSVALGLGSLAGLYVLRQHRDSKQQKERAERRHGAFVEYWGPPPEQAAAAARHQSRPPPPPPGTPAAAAGGDGDDQSSSSNWNAPADLAGLTFAVKDIFDIAGRVTGFGSPAWRASHAPATRTAHAVAAASAAGAACVGVTHVDEMAYSINGENAHYGTPDNPAPGCAGRVPGGSSSGSAVAVAAGYADFALGTDTGGSVRVPAAWCGVVGVRPSHGAVSVAGVVPMAQSLDVVGWLARDARVARAVGRALLGPGGPRPRRPERVLVAEDLVAASCCRRGKRRDEERWRQERVVAAAVAAVRRAVGPVPVARVRVGEYLGAEVPELAAAGQEEEEKGQVRGVAALEGVRDAVRLVQALEFRGNHEAWVAAERPVLGPGIADRVRAAMAAPHGDDERVRRARAVRRGVAAAMARLLQGDAVLVMPTVPAGPPPRRGRPATELKEVRSRAFVLLSLAGASGCCQVSVPVGNVDGMGGAPGSVSFLARLGADHLLLDTLVAMQEASGTPDRWKLDLD